MSAAESTELLREIRDGLQSLSFRVESLEIKANGHGGNGDHTYSTSTVNYQSPQVGASAQSASTDSVEADYQRIRSSVQSIRLPADLTLQESRQGIKKEDLSAFNIIAKSARFSATLLKLCASHDKTPTNTEDIFCIAYAKRKFLQDEYAALVVNFSFDPNVAKLFRALQKKKTQVFLKKPWSS